MIANSFVMNLASVRVLEKCGMTPTITFPLNEADERVVVRYEILRGDFAF